MPRQRHLLILLPGLLLVLLLCLIPVFMVAKVTLFDPDFTLRHVERFFAQPVYLNVLLRTLRTALWVALLCLAIGYPTAYFIVTQSESARPILLFLILLPMWMSILIQTYAWMVLLGREGIANSLLMELGLTGQPLQLLFNSSAVRLVMVQILLPIMILTCFGGMSAIDRSLVPAARIMGASRFAAFREVFLPLSLRAALNGTTIVFILSMGFFITPALLGGRSDAMIGNLITLQVEQGNWGFAGTIALVLLASALCVMWLINMLGRRFVYEARETA